MYSNNAGGRALSQQQRMRVRLAQKKLNAGASESEIMRIVQPCLDLERRNEEIASLVQSTNQPVGAMPVGRNEVSYNHGSWAL
jgi:hypothetical protein